MISKRITSIITSSAAVLTLVSAAQAGTATAGKAPQQIAETKEESPFDKIWSLFSLYKNDSNPILQELNFSGRYQGQYYSIDGDKSSDDDWDHRRFRLGVKAKMLDKKLSLNAEIFSELNPGGEFYAGFKNLNLSYKFSDEFNVKVGKLEPEFTYDYSMSDTLHIFFERNALVNQFKNDYTSGISVFGKSGKWSYELAATSNTPDKEFGEFNGGWSTTGFISYDLKDALSVDKAVWRMDFMHSEHDANDTLMTGFDNGLATSLDLKTGPYGLVSEVIAGFGNSNNVGLILTPTYDITKKLQFVGRYTLALSDEDKGQNPQKRYESFIGAPKGDVYNSVYAGLNYYLYGHKLKLMTGVEYATMSGGDSSWTYLAGIRAFW